MRCHTCTIIQRTKGRGQGFQHRFAKNGACNLVSGCPVLATGAGGGLVQLPFGGSGQGAAGVPTV